MDKYSYSSVVGFTWLALLSTVCFIVFHPSTQLSKVVLIVLKDRSIIRENFCSTFMASSRLPFYVSVSIT